MDEFINAIFPETIDGSRPLFCGFKEDPNTVEGWKAITKESSSRHLAKNNNCYFALSTFKPNEKGEYRAQKALAVAAHAILLDDIQTKSNAEIRLPLSWLIETSPGNFQGGLILAEPCQDQDLFEKVVKALGNNGWTDPGAKGVARWSRLPMGRNTKNKYLVDGVAPQVTLKELHPDRRYSVTEIITAFDLILEKGKPTYINNRQPDRGDGQVVVSALKEKGIWKKEVEPRKHQLTCPWVMEHTDGVDSGSVYYEPSTKYPIGGFTCQHGHCDDRTISDLKSFLGILPLPKYVEEFNREFFVSQESGKTSIYAERYDPDIERTDLVRFSFQSFRDFHNNRLVSVGQKRDGSDIMKPRGTAWIEDPRRKQFEGITLEPDESKLPHGYYNLWQGFGVDPVKGDWHLMYEHLFHIICKSKMSNFRYLMGWLATMVQMPEKPAGVAVVLRGGKGTGKGVLGNALVDLFGKHSLHITSTKHLVGNFNYHLRSCIFLFADEAYWAGDKQGENVLKGHITEPHLTIEGKGQNAVQVRNRLHILMASNSDWVVPASRDERRYFVLDVSDSKIQDNSYFKPLIEEQETGGLSAMLFDLLNYDLTGFDIRRVPQTDGLLEQQIHSFDPTTMWWFQKLQKGELLYGADSWGEAGKKSLFDDYLIVASHAGMKHRAYETSFGMVLRKLLPKGWPKERKSRECFEYMESGIKRMETGWVKYIKFPDLEICRKHFSELMRAEIDWSIEEYEEEEEKESAF